MVNKNSGGNTYFNKGVLTDANTPFNIQNQISSIALYGLTLLS